MPRALCRTLPLAPLLALAGCCTPFGPEPIGPPPPFPVADAGPPRDAGPFIFRDAAPLDAPHHPPDTGSAAGCALELLGGALCDDEPCIGPARRISCPGGVQHLGLAAMDDGSTWLSASYPPRLLHRVGERLDEHVLPLRGDGQAHLLVDARGELRALYADSSLAIGALPDDAGRLRLELRSDRAYFVVVGAGIDATDVLHVAWIDDGPALHAGRGPLDDAAAFADEEASPTYFADSAMALDPFGVPHVATWRHRTPASAGRDLVVRDGDGPPHAIFFHAEPNDDGTNVSLAAGETALVASLDLADGLHVLVPDDAVADTEVRDVLVPGSAPLALSGCPDVPAPGPPPGGACDVVTCTETGSGTLRRAHEVVALPAGRFGLLWLERSVERVVARDAVCGEAGCACVRSTLDERSSTVLVLGLLDPATGVPERTLVLPLGDVEAASLVTARSGERLVVAMQASDLSAILVEIDLALVLP